MKQMNFYANDIAWLFYLQKLTEPIPAAVNTTLKK